MISQLWNIKLTVFARCIWAFLTLRCAWTTGQGLTKNTQTCKIIGYLIGVSHEKWVIIGHRYRLKKILILHPNLIILYHFLFLSWKCKTISLSSIFPPASGYCIYFLKPRNTMFYHLFCMFICFHIRYKSSSAKKALKSPMTQTVTTLPPADGKASSQHREPVSHDFTSAEFI